MYSSVDMNLDLFLNSLFCMLIYMPLLTPILYYLNYCSFVVIHTVRKCEHFDSVLPYKNYLGSSMPFAFPYNFYYQLSNFYRKYNKPYRILIRIILNLWINLARTDMSKIFVYLYSYLALLKKFSRCFVDF